MVDRRTLVRRLRKAGGRVGFTVITHRRFTELRRGASTGRRYAQAIQEIESLWRDRSFADLPDRKGRHELLCELTGTQPSEAMHVLGWLHESLTVPGVVCELGCAAGATSALMANELLPGDRQLWLFDSFGGLSAPGKQDVLIDDIFDRGDMSAYAGSMAYPEAAVRGRVAAVGWPADRLHVVAGFVEDTLARPDLPEQVAFAYVDMDLYSPIARALTFLHDRVSPGGIVLVDDYGWFSAGAQTAVDEFIAAHPDDYEVRRPPSWAGHFIGLRRR